MLHISISYSIGERLCALPLTLSQSKTLPKVENSPCKSSAEHVALRFPTNTLVELGGRARDSSTTRGLPLYSLPSRCLMALWEKDYNNYTSVAPVFVVCTGICFG